MLLLLSPEHPTPPRPPCSPLRACGIGVGLSPSWLRLDHLRGFLHASKAVQFSTQVVALPFGLFPPAALFRHPLAQRGLRHLAAGAFGAQLLPEVAQLVRVIAHNLVQAGRYHTSELLTGRYALCVQCMHIYTC